MTDPVGLIGQAGATHGRPMNPTQVAGKDQGGPSFRDVLMANIDQVNKLQSDARVAIEDLTSGRRSDLEGVLIAAEKADTAFKMLQAVRNKVVQAYDEIQQIRV